MNNQTLIKLITESARLEANAARLYLLLSMLYTEDRDFWHTLHKEELKHEAVFRSFLDQSLPMGLFPEQMVHTRLETLQLTNGKIESDLGHFLMNHRTKREAYEYALQVEKSAGEAVYQQAMEMDSDSEALNLVQRINADCKDHLARIENMLDSVVKGNSGPRSGRPGS